MKTRKTDLEIETNDNTTAAQLLQSFSLKSMNGKLVLPFESKEQTAVINKLLVQSGIEVYALHPQQNDLEQLFLDITSSNS
jgi:ABC-2 type transport system ATP-binding protein